MPVKRAEVFGFHKVKSRGAKLAELPMLKISSAPKLLEARFSIPQSGCASQYLRLSGTPAEFPTEQDATIREVRVERIGA